MPRPSPWALTVRVEVAEMEADGVLQALAAQQKALGNLFATDDATAAAATGAMLTAMACCPLPTGRAGHGSAPRRVTEAST